MIWEPSVNWRINLEFTKVEDINEEEIIVHFGWKKFLNDAIILNVFENIYISNITIYVSWVKP